MSLKNVRVMKVAYKHDPSFYGVLERVAVREKDQVVTIFIKGCGDTQENFILSTFNSKTARELSERIGEIVEVNKGMLVFRATRMSEV